MKKSKPIRMCVVCRERFLQEQLIRLQCKDKKLIGWEGIGRSFYVCKSCLNNKKLVKYVSSVCGISKEEAKKQIFHFQFSILK